MKKDILYIVILLSFMTNFSDALYAQSTKDKFDALNDYLETIEGYSTRKIIVISEKTSANITLEILKVNDIQSIDSDGKRKGDETFYNEKDWRIMKKKNKNPLLTEKDGSLEDKYWTEKDFRRKKIVFISVKGRSWETAFKDYSSGTGYDYVVYSFSEPIYYKKDKYLIFTILKGDIIGGNGGNTHIVVMRKNNGKWIRTHEGYTDLRS